MNQTTRHKRILYRATHRGTHEADLLIGGYLSPRLARYDAASLDALERLLELPDPDLADWISGRTPIPAAHDHPILRAMRDEASRTPCGDAPHASQDDAPRDDAASR